MALVPSANASTKSFTYDSSNITLRRFAFNEVGEADVAASGDTTGNGAYALFVAPCNCNVFSTTFTVVTPGTGATSNITVYKVAANNGANLTQNVAVGNLVFTGANVAGNVFSTGPYTYNVFSNGVNSASNTAIPGGLPLLTGDVLVAIHTGNTLYAAAVTDFQLASGELNPATVIV